MYKRQVQHVSDLDDIAVSDGLFLADKYFTISLPVSYTHLDVYKRQIVPYVTNGRNSQVGHDGHFNIFKKKRSTVLKEYLQSADVYKRQVLPVRDLCDIVV